MALHVCRDFLTLGNPLTIDIEKMCLYYQAIFLRWTLGFTVVGQTNFNIDGSTLLIASGDDGSINMGSGDEYAFQPNDYSVSAADIDRILVLKSPANGMVNSGLFRVTAVDTSNNYLYINYRSGDEPPAETGVTWALFADEVVFNSSLNLTGNGGPSGTYTGRGSATQSRIILQSPSSIGWQVRIAIENAVDTNTSNGLSPARGSVFGVTSMPGLGGDSAGDFPAGGQHLHYPMWRGKCSSVFEGTTVGLFPYFSQQSRIYAWGDDETGTMFMAARNVISTFNSGDSFVHFGLAEDEEQPLPPKNIQRLFVIGAGRNSQASGIAWACGPGSSTSRTGMSFGLSNSPISCIYSIYNSLDGQLFVGFQPLRNSTYANDSPYTGRTELLPVDLVVGTHDLQRVVSFNSGPEILILEGRRLGRAPFVRLGRSNYGEWQVASDINRSWLHLKDGIYLPWKGAILP